MVVVKEMNQHTIIIIPLPCFEEILHHFLSFLRLFVKSGVWFQKALGGKVPRGERHLTLLDRFNERYFMVHGQSHLVEDDENLFTHLIWYISQRIHLPLAGGKRAWFPLDPVVYDESFYHAIWRMAIIKWQGERKTSPNKIIVFNNPHGIGIWVHVMLRKWCMAIHSLPVLVIAPRKMWEMQPNTLIICFLARLHDFCDPATTCYTLSGDVSMRTDQSLLPNIASDLRRKL